MTVGGVLAGYYFTQVRMPLPPRAVPINPDLVQNFRHLPRLLSRNYEPRKHD